MSRSEAATSSVREAEEPDPHPQFLLKGTSAGEIYHALFVSHLVKTWIPLVVNKPEIYEGAGEVIRWILKVIDDRAFFLTRKGYMGISSSETAAGDLVYTLLGGDVPFVLREPAVKSEYSLVGEAYVHIIMDGELWEMTVNGEQLISIGGDLAIEEVVLV